MQACYYTAGAAAGLLEGGRYVVAEALRLVPGGALLVRKKKTKKN